MLHPATELRFIDSTIGYGVFATQFIPKGTITWVRDELDQVFTPERFARISPFLSELFERYTFVDKWGDHILCWDHARYVNHSCEAACLAPGYGFEIAVRDIAVGDQVTSDYGALNLDVGFRCACSSPVCRKEIQPDELLRYGDQWDAIIADSFSHFPVVKQPLWELVQEKDELARVLAQEAPLASCRLNYYDRLRAGLDARWRDSSTGVRH